MNSMSKGHCRDQKENCSKKSKETDVILKCGSSVPATVLATTPANTAFRLSSLTLNTRRIDDPCIKFEFASNLVFTTPAAGAIAVNLNFQIFKQCKNQTTPTPIGPVWTFTRAAAATVAGVILADTFTFLVCDCDLCPDDCCTYFVAATTVGATNGTVAINNPILSALVVENENKCHCC